MSANVLEAGLFSKLSTNSDLTTLLGGTLIYNKIAPQGTTGDYVIFQWQGGGEENDTPTRSRNPLYLVKAIASTQAAALAIDAKIEAALHDQQLTISGWNNYWMARETDVNFMQLTGGGNPKYHVGALYRIAYDEE